MPKQGGKRLLQPVFSVVLVIVQLVHPKVNGIPFILTEVKLCKKKQTKVNKVVR